MPVIINEMIANVRPDSETVAVDNDRPQASGSDQEAQRIRDQMNIDQEREERLQID